MNNKTKPGHAHSPLTIQRMKEAAYKIPVEAYHFDSGIFIDTYDSHLAAALALNVNPSNLRKVLGGTRAHTNGYTFRLVSNILKPFCSFNLKKANS